MDLSIIFQVHRENSGHSSDINGIDWENCSMRAYHHGAVPCIHLALSVVLRGSVQETRGVARIVEERHAAIVILAIHKALLDVGTLAGQKIGCEKRNIT